LVKIDENKCVGCGICVNICPQGFEILNGKARIEDENASCIVEAVNRQAFRPGFINGIGSSFERGRSFRTGRTISLGHRGNKGRGRRRHLK
jgi:ferredoxin